ncbi:zinc finger protein ZAT11-like [Cucurbita moschata]|uniref:Zinc finger protein ZAT11-like n=1 Tax=Cucurbita moschata TaxID=3662 RepID=A0A6J1GDW3_CUCMO|nr:zinc finger protein ZAT11-like [Cucurbita moschata]
MAAKRIRQEFEVSDMAKSPMFISYGIESSNPIIPFQNASVFDCKTCNRHFSSFQALGGHRASHKRPRTTAEDPKEPVDSKHKMHECGLCGQEFSSGQALGGHMRRHRVTAVPEKIPVLKRSGSRRIMCLDLNLTPLENDLKMLFGKMTPTVDLVI